MTYGNYQMSTTTVIWSKLLYILAIRDESRECNFSDFRMLNGSGNQSSARKIKDQI